MTTQTASSNSMTTSRDRNPRERLLQRVLYGNAIFSSLSAGLFLLGRDVVTNFAGLNDVTVLGLLNGIDFITFIGVSLVGFALYLLFIASRNPLDTRMAWSIVASDLAWVIGSWILLITGAIPFSDAGNWGVLIISDIVLIFAIAQIVGIRRINR